MRPHKRISICIRMAAHRRKIVQIRAKKAGCKSNLKLQDGGRQQGLHPLLEYIFTSHFTGRSFKEVKDFYTLCSRFP